MIPLIRRRLIIKGQVLQGQMRLQSSAITPVAVAGNAQLNNANLKGVQRRSLLPYASNENQKVAHSKWRNGAGIQPLKTLRTIRS